MESEVKKLTRLAEIGKKPRHADLEFLTLTSPTLTIPYKWYHCQLLLLVAVEPILIHVLHGVYIHKRLQLSIISLNWSGQAKQVANLYWNLDNYFL